MTGSLDRFTGSYVAQVDAAISLPLVVSAAVNNVLPTSSNVKIYSIETDVTWGVTQPTPLVVLVTVDGIVHTHTQANPVSTTPYYCMQSPALTAAAQLFSTDAAVAANTRQPLYEGRSVKVDAVLTWAITQPDPLVVRVKWAKKPSGP